MVHDILSDDENYDSTNIITKEATVNLAEVLINKTTSTSACDQNLTGK